MRHTQIDLNPADQVVRRAERVRPAATLRALRQRRSCLPTSRELDESLLARVLPTGALARGDFHRALEMLAGKNGSAVELSALRQDELAPLVEQLDRLDLSQFEYVSFHAPSSMEPAFETIALGLLEQVARRGWPIIVHPDAVHSLKEWVRLGDRLCIENMDKRKPTGQTAQDLSEIFKHLPNASFCFDIGHARQVDPTM